MTAPETDDELATVSVLLVTAGFGSDGGARLEEMALGSVEALVVSPIRTAATPHTVLAATDVQPALGPDNGRGSAVWAGLQRTVGTVLVVVDLDRHGVPSPADVRALAQACTGDAQVVLGVNPLPASDPVLDHLVRPALALHHPHLAHLRSPLASAWSVRRDNLEMLPIPVGEGAALAALLDTDNLFGVDAVREVRLGSWRSASADGDTTEAGQRLRTAIQVLAVLERRLPQRLSLPEDPVGLPGTDERVRVDECPPAAALPGYLAHLQQRRA